MKGGIKMTINTVTAKKLYMCYIEDETSRLIKDVLYEDELNNAPKDCQIKWVDFEMFKCFDRYSNECVELKEAVINLDWDNYKFEIIKFNITGTRAINKFTKKFEEHYNKLAYMELEEKYEEYKSGEINAKRLTKKEKDAFKRLKDWMFNKYGDLEYV
jgi:hypothetical protein